MRAVVMALLLGIAMPDTLAAQEQRRERATIGAFEVWGGLARNSPQWGLLGETPDMRLGLVALRWTRPLGDAPHAGQLPALELTFDIVPLARISPSLVSLRGTGQPCLTAALCVLRPVQTGGSALFPPGSPFGFGITPIGFTRRFARASQVSPFIGANGGVLWFDRAAPTTKAARFNFTASAEVGLRFGPVDEAGLTLSYRFHHISNAGTAGENPGLASHLISIGIHRPRR